MTKRCFFAAIVGVMLLSSISMAATYGGGSGTASDPYLILTAEQMNTIGTDPNDWNGCFMLMADIDMSAYTGTSYNIIGNATTRFAGTFEGNNHIIGNLTYTTTDAVNYVGLFGCTDGAIIQNVGLENVNLSTGGSWVGGLTGYKHDGQIKGCYVTGSVSGDRIGGLVGYNFLGTITTCYTVCSVSGTTTSYVGGLVGYDDYSSPVSYCYAAGPVSGGNNIGGLMGYKNFSSVVDACFWDTQTTLQMTSADGTGATTAQMQTLSVFTEAGWDFSATDGDPADWWMPNNSYPQFAWQMLYGGGMGKAEDPWQIWTAEQMNTIGVRPQDWNKYFILMADIDMSAYTGTQYNLIGNEATPFTGTFDGNGHVISNLTYMGTMPYVGLFGYISNGTIQNVGLENVTLSTTGSFVGGLAGHVTGTVSRCYVQGGSVSGDWAVGGLIGNNESASVTDCYATAAVNSTGSFSGGLVGRYWVGSITNCYCTGTVQGSSYVGGFAGWNNAGTFAACFWDTQTSGQSVAVSYGPLEGTAGKTTAEMQTLSTFTDAGWDFSTTDGDAADWFLPYGQYPRLSWESVYGQSNGGSGTTQDPYLIYTAGQMNTIGTDPNDWSGCFKLMVDLDMSAYTGTQYNIIGNEATPFTGTFDGNGRIIRNLTYTHSGDGYVGLFGYTGSSSVIQNLGVENAAISGSVAVTGVLAGRNSGTIQSCYVTGSVSSTVDLGGMAGRNMGTISFCHAAVAVNGATGAGGLVGYNPGSISNCYATGAVTGNNYVGGLVAFHDGPLLSNCYATGLVSGTGSVSGLVGFLYTPITASFWDTKTSGTTDGVGNQDPDPSGAAGKTTAQMKAVSTFAAAGWDFVNTWTIVDLQTYPFLRTASDINPADINFSGKVDLEDLAILAANWLK